MTAALCGLRHEGVLGAALNQPQSAFTSASWAVPMRRMLARAFCRWTAGGSAYRSDTHCLLRSVLLVADLSGPGLRQMRAAVPVGWCPFCREPLPLRKAGAKAPRHCGKEMCNKAYHKVYQRDRRSGKHVPKTTRLPPRTKNYARFTRAVFMRAAGLTLKEISAVVGISADHLSRIFVGWRRGK